MKKAKCKLCAINKAQRKCVKRNDILICSRCCADSRDTVCTNCHHYIEAKHYQSSRAIKTRKKHFIAELNEEVEKAVDDALALVERGSIREGEHMLEVLRNKHPMNHMVNYGTGVVHALKGDIDAAIDYFTKATEVFPYLIEAHFNKAVAYKNKLDIRNAIKSFSEVIEIGDSQDDLVRQASEFVTGFEKQVMAVNNITLARFFEAKDEFDSGYSFMEKGAWENAIAHFGKAIRLNGMHPQSYGNIGLCYAQLGHKEDALASFDKAIEIDPNYEPAILNRSIVERLEEGEPLNQARFESVNYYQDYPLKNVSLLQEMLNGILRK